jgi:hypothetical protein
VHRRYDSFKGRIGLGTPFDSAGDYIAKTKKQVMLAHKFVRQLKGREVAAGGEGRKMHRLVFLCDQAAMDNYGVDELARLPPRGAAGSATERVPLKRSMHMLYL